MQTDQTRIGRVSVVIPAYNAADFLAATLQSVVNQSQRPYEIIVVDDGSTDATPEIARSFGVTLISGANAGVSAARNAGVKAASGEYIAYLDADDVWDAEKLALQSAALASYPLPAFSFTDYRLFDERGVWRKKSELRAHWAFRRIAGNSCGRINLVIEARGKKPVLYDSYIPPSSVLVRRADVLAVGGFDESLRVTEDYEFYLRLFKRLPAVVVMQPLLLYRRHAGQVTSKGPAMKAGFFAVARLVAASARELPGRRYALHRAHGVSTPPCCGHAAGAKRNVRRSRLKLRSEFERAMERDGVACARRRKDVPQPFGSGAFQLARGLWKRRPGRR